MNQKDPAKIDWSFPLRILTALGVLGLLAWYPLVTYGSRDVIEASLAGALLATVNVLLGFAAIEYSFGRSMTTFFKYVLGGMGIRLLGMALVLVAMIKLLHLHAGALVGSLGICYMVFLTLEILFIQKKVNVHHQ